MNLQKLFIAWLLCSIIGTVSKIMHLSPLISTTFLALTLILSVFLIVLVYKKLAR